MYCILVRQSDCLFFSFANIQLIIHFQTFLAQKRSLWRSFWGVRHPKTCRKAFFLKKVCEKFCRFGKLPYLCTRFRKATGAPMLRWHFFARYSGGVESDLWQTANRNTRQAAHTHYIYYKVICTSRSHSFRRRDKRTMEQDSLAGQTELKRLISITVKSLILAQDER